MSYNPMVGRWMQQDPAGHVDGLNLYQVEQSNPTRFIDPSGLKCRIAVRCGAPENSVAKSAGAQHCGIVISDDSGVTAVDGSGGNVNRFDPVKADSEEAVATWGQLSGWSNLPDSTCACIRNSMGEWNKLKIARDNLINNSNWALKCLTKKCGVTIPWAPGDEPIGWNSVYGKECKTECFVTYPPGTPAPVWVTDTRCPECPNDFIPGQTPKGTL